MIQHSAYALNQSLTPTHASLPLYNWLCYILYRPASASYYPPLSSCPVSVPPSSTSIYSHIYKYSTSYSRIIRFASRKCSPLHAYGHDIDAHGANINYLLRLIVIIIKIMIINSSSLVYNLICKESTNGHHHKSSHHHHQCRFLAHKTKNGY